MLFKRQLDREMLAAAANKYQDLENRVSKTIWLSQKDVTTQGQPDSDLVWYIGSYPQEQSFKQLQ